MTNHPNRGKLSRHALELIATLSAGGIALDREQQQAVNRLCRAAAAYRRLQEERCNGPAWHPSALAMPDAAERQKWWEDYAHGIEKRETAIRGRIKDAWGKLPAAFHGVTYQGDPRGVTVKLVMHDSHKRLHDSFDREGVCVPGS